MNLITPIKNILKDSVSVSPEQAAKFFKTSRGAYAEHDVFMGVSVPTIRKIAKNFKELPFETLTSLLTSKINEERLLALVILVMRYQKLEDQNQKEELYQFYLKYLLYVNNWNLVDASAHLILGAHLWDKDRSLLFELAKSNNLWERRIAIVSTWYFIKRDDFEWTFKIATVLLNDTHDLIHKAVGWMLREAGKRNKEILIKFLDTHSIAMPRTLLRYAIEKFPEIQRKSYLLKKRSKK